MVNRWLVAINIRYSSNGSVNNGFIRDHSAQALPKLLSTDEDRGQRRIVVARRAKCPKIPAFSVLDGVVRTCVTKRYDLLIEVFGESTEDSQAIGGYPKCSSCGDGRVVGRGIIAGSGRVLFVNENIKGKVRGEKFTQEEIGAEATNARTSDNDLHDLFESQSGRRQQQS